MKLIRLFYPFLLISFLTTGIHGQAYVEDFENGLPSDWLSYTENGFDFTNWFDLSLYTRLEIDYYAFNLAFGSETVPDLHIGILENPGNFSSFVSIYELSATNTTSQTFSIDIGAYRDMGNVCFKLVGEKSHIIYLDNFKLYDDVYESNVPVAVRSISISPVLDGSNNVSMSWVNPDLEADGDMLTELNSIVLKSEDVEVLEFENPMIGQAQDFQGTVQTPGFYKFEVFGKNSFGEGHKVFAPRIWIGLDQPGPVRNVSINRAIDSVHIQWESPVEGANGSYFDGIVDSYTIIRSDGKEFNVPGNEAAFTDILDTEGSIRYEIFAENGSGIGSSVFSQPIFYTTDEHLYYEDFNFDIVKEPGANLDFDYDWTSQSSVTNSYWEWFSSNFIGQNAGELSWLWTNAGSPSDMVRAVSPSINTEGYSSVSLSYNFYFEAAGSSTYTVMLQSSGDGGLNWTDIEAIEINAFSQGSYTKTIANADVGSDQFKFAFNRLGPTNQNPFMRIDNIRLKNQPGIDLRVSDLKVPKIVEPGTSVNINAFVENNSSEVTDGRVNCVIRNRFGMQDEIASYEINYDNMAIGEIVEETFGPWIAEEGEYLVELSINNDQDLITNNNSVTQVMNVYKLQDKQMVIIEEFSGTWCAYCPGAALAVEDLYAEGYNVAAITYHRSDAYETEIVESRMDLYSILGFPTSMFDGVTKSEGGDLENSIVDDYRPIVETQRSIKSPVQIEFISAELNNTNPGEDKIYDVSVRLESESIIEDPNLVLIGVLTESGIEEEWQSLDVLDFVQREYDLASVSLSSGEAIIDLGFAIEAEVNIENSDLVVFVQSLEDNQIYNGASLEVTNTIEPSSTQNLSEIDMQIYPNPSHSRLFIELDDKLMGLKQCTIIDMHGQIVKTESFQTLNTSLDLSSLNQGMYFIEITNNKCISRLNFVKL